MHSERFSTAVTATADILWIHEYWIYRLHRFRLWQWWIYEVSYFFFSSFFRGQNRTLNRNGKKTKKKKNTPHTHTPQIPKTNKSIHRNTHKEFQVCNNKYKSHWLDVKESMLLMIKSHDRCSLTQYPYHWHSRPSLFPSSFVSTGSAEALSTAIHSSSVITEKRVKNKQTKKKNWLHKFGFFISRARFACSSLTINGKTVDSFYDIDGKEGKNIPPSTFDQYTEYIRVRFRVR